MKYSEFLSAVIDSCQYTFRTSEGSPSIYLCNEAKYLTGRYDMPDYEKHLKRFLAHIKRLLTIQHKMRVAEFGCDAIDCSTLGYYFQYNHLNKLNWLIALRDRIQKQEAKEN